MKTRKMLKLLFPIFLSAPIALSACNIQKSNEQENKEDIFEESVIDKYENDRSAYLPLSDWYFEILKNASYNYFGWDKETKKYFNQLFTPITKSNLNHPVNQLSLKDKINNIQSNNYVYSKIQDFLNNNPNNVISYNYKEKFKNQEINYEDGLNLTAREILDVGPNPENKKINIIPNNKQSLIDYINKQVENHWREVSIDKNYYQIDSFYDDKEKGYKTRFVPWTSITTDLKYYYVKNPLAYYEQGSDTSDIKLIRQLVPEKDVEIRHQLNYAFENANLQISKDPNAYNDINSRNVRLFNRGQGTILYADNQKALILTAKHVINNLLNTEQQFSMNQAYEITFFEKTDNNRELNKQTITFNHNDLKVIYLSPNRKSTHIFRNYDQALIEINLNNKINLSNNRAFLNPMKLNYDASYIDTNLTNYVSSNNKYMMINNQGYFLNQDITNNLKQYQTLKVQGQYPNPFKTLDEYLSKEKKYTPKYDFSLLANRFYNETDLNTNSFITANNIQRYNNWIDNRQSKLLFKGWNDNYLNLDNTDYFYSTPIIGLNYDQNEFFNLYDIQTNQAYYSSSNLWININQITDDHGYPRGGHIVKLYLGDMKPGNGGQGFFNTKYEISNQIRNEINNYNDNNLNLNNYLTANKSRKTDTVAYDEMKYILIGGITYYENFEQELDKNNIPIGLHIAEPISPAIVRKYNDYLNKLIK